MSDSEPNTFPALPRSEPSTPCPTPCNEELLDTVLEEVMKVELRNRLTGEVINFSPKKDEAIASEVPQAMLNSLYVSNSSLESEVYDNDNDNELVFETKDDDKEDDDDDDAITESDTESESVDENTDEDNKNTDEDNEEEEEDPLDEEDNSKRYVVFDNGNPIVIILNQNKPQNDIPGIIVFMMTLVCGLWLFNNTCKLCTLIDDKCIFRLP